MNEVEQIIYNAITVATERDCGKLDDNDQIAQTMNFDSLTTAVFLLELESHFPGRVNMKTFRRDMTFGELKSMLSA